MNDDFVKIAARIWHEAAGPAEHLDALAFSGPRQVLPSWFDVTGLAAGSVAAATLAAAEFQAARTETSIRRVRVDSTAASAAFAAEGLFTPVGWELPPVWDPIAGNYQAQDGWIRLHTNYAYHRAAVERVLGAGDKDSVAAAAADWKAADLEAAVVAAGGCAAMMHSREEWLASPPGAATAAASTLSAAPRPAALRPAALRPVGAGPVEAGQGAAGQGAAVQGAALGGTAGRGAAGEAATRPYAGIRVLDLTRVIAGPVATKFLAAYGADVLRVDPPGFDEVAAIVPETTAGKRATALDLTEPAGPASLRAWSPRPTCWSRGCVRTHLTGWGTAMMRSPR